MKKQGRTVDGGGRRRAARRALFLGAWCVLIWLGASALLGGTARPGVASAQALPPDAVVEKAPAAMADGVTAARVDEGAAMVDEAALAFSAQSPAAGSGVQFGLHVGDTPEAFAWQAPLAIRLGADVVALEFRWDVVEPQASRFAWAAFDEAVAAAREAGARIVGVLHYPAHLPPLSRSLRIGWPSAHADDWDFFVQRVVARYGADIEDWIVVRGRAGARDPVLAAADAEYDAQLAQVTAQAVRAAGGRRVFAAAPGADLLWLAVFATRGGLAAVDGLALDVNRWPAAPEGLALVIDDVQQLAAQMGLAPELWVWRFGYPTHRGLSDTEPRRPGVSAAQQAAYMVRAHVLLASAGVSTVFWRELMDAGRSETDAAANFGLYEAPGRGKPAAFAYRTMLDMLAGLSYVPAEAATLVLSSAAPAPQAEPALAAEELAASGASPAEAGAIRSQAAGPVPAVLADAVPTAPDAATEKLHASGGLRLDAEAIVVAASGQPLHAHLFAGKGRAVLVLWTSPYPGDGEALLQALDGAPVRVYDLYGRPLDTVVPSPEPLYLELLMPS